MSELPDETRICDLSIPWPHDAATWNALTDWVRDQTYDEKTLFRMGARGFDFRVWKYFGEFSMTHGNFGWFLNTIDTEVNDHPPDKSEIGNETLFFDVTPQSDEEDRKDACAYMVKKLVEKYGLWRFSYLHPNMTLGEARGKIFLVTNDYQYLNENELDTNPNGPRLYVPDTTASRLGGIMTTTTTVT